MARSRVCHEFHSPPGLETTEKEMHMHTPKQTRISRPVVLSVRALLASACAPAAQLVQPASRAKDQAAAIVALARDAMARNDLRAVILRVTVDGKHEGHLLVGRRRSLGTRPGWRILGTSFLLALSPALPGIGQALAGGGSPHGTLPASGSSATRNALALTNTTFPAVTVAQLDSLIQSTMKEKNLPGAAVGIWIPGQGEYVAAFGSANLRTGRPRQASDPFRIASITKTFTATAILRLADQGRLSTSDPLSRWFPDFPGADRITVKNLLMMRSGIAEFADKNVLRSYYQKPLAPFSAEDAVRIVVSKADTFTPPNQKTVYTNTNYVLLRKIVEKVSGQNMDAFLRQNVFAPLGLRDTFYATTPLLPGELRGYSWEAGTKSFRDMTLLNPNLPDGAGAVVSTLNDLQTYVRALCTGQLLKPATHAERMAGEQLEGAPPFVKYGEGIGQSGPFCGHNGSIFGFSSQAFYLPSKDAVIVVNVNRLDMDDQNQSSELFLRLTRALFPQEVNW